MSYTPTAESTAWRNQHSRRDAITRVILARDRYCRIRLKCRGARATTVDHIIALSHHGAPFDPANCRGACGPCNFARGNGARQRAATSTAVRRPTRVSTW